MHFKFHTIIDIDAERAWEMLKKSETFSKVTRGMLGVNKRLLPEYWNTDAPIHLRLYFFHIFPGWKHSLEFKKIDNENFECVTQERGGLITDWQHKMTVEKLTDGKCRYTDEIDISAGLFNPVVWIYVVVFFRYRHFRWRQIARSLSIE